MMLHIEKYDTDNEILERVDQLKTEQDYYEEYFHVIGLEDKEPDWTDYMGLVYNPHSNSTTFKDIFTNNVKAEKYLEARDLESDLISSYLKFVEEGRFLLVYNSDSLKQNDRRDSVEATIQKGPEE